MKKRTSRIIALLISLVMISTSFAFADTQGSIVNYEGFMSNEVQQMNIYYDDTYWAGSSSTYNEHLASLSMALALTGYDRKATNAVNALNGIGCTKVKSKEYKTNTENCVAAVMGSKKLSDGTTLIPIVVRSEKTNLIWAKNIQADAKGEAAGYKAAASKVYNYATNYIKSLKVKKFKVWIMGHSRYGAIANITAKKLNSKYGKKNVYAYCFENPMTAVKSSKNVKMTNIHNVRALDSGVTKVLPSYMKFDKYGKWDKTFAVKDGNEATMQEMLAKINTASATYQSPKNCKWASLSVTKAMSGLKDLSIEKFCEEGASVSQEELWNQVVARLKTLASSRKAYAVTKSAKTIEAAKKLGYKKSDVYTIEKAIQNTIRLLNDLDGNTEKSQKIVQEVFANVLGTSDISKVNIFSLMGLLDTPIGKLVSGPVMSDKLTAKDVIGTSKTSYAKYVEGLWKQTGLEKSKQLTKSQKKQLKLILATMTEPLVKDLEKDFDGDKKEEVFVTVLYNINSLIQAHYPEVTMAWLMTEDSNYIGK